MTATFNGKTVTKTGASKPSGEPAKIPTKEIQSPYSKAKAAGGTAVALVSGIGNS